MSEIAKRKNFNPLSGPRYDSYPRNKVDFGEESMRQQWHKYSNDILFSNPFRLVLKTGRKVKFEESGMGCVLLKTFQSRRLIHSLHDARLLISFDSHYCQTAFVLDFETCCLQLGCPSQCVVCSISAMYSFMCESILRNSSWALWISFSMFSFKSAIYSSVSPSTPK